MVTNLNETFAAVQAASRELAILDDTIINQILNAVADAAIAETPFILSVSTGHTLDHSYPFVRGLFHFLPE